MSQPVSQPVRQSQFVLTYGPGAILEGQFGPRVIPRPDIGIFIQGLSPSQYEISDQRMSQGLLQGARIARLPSNAELGRPSYFYVYHTRNFPTWKLCLNVNRHNGDFYVLHSQWRCPVCGNSSKRRSESIRFIRACSAGHMDDFDWWYFVHAESECSYAEWFAWYGGGGSLARVLLECPRCHKTSISLGQAYGMRWPCSGRYPEDEPLDSQPNRPGCAESARIVQRQASNLRIPEIRTLFSIPPRHTAIHRLLQLQPIYHAIAATNPSSPSQIQDIFRNLRARGLIGDDALAEMKQYGLDEVLEAAHDVLSPVPSTYRELILDEFNVLVNGSVVGIPPVARRGRDARDSRIVFEIDPNLVVKSSGPNGTVFRVTPIPRLTTVTVQRGYRREVDTQAQAREVDASFRDPSESSQRWYLGTEFLGEGVFLMIDSDQGCLPPMAGAESSKWKDAFTNPESYPKEVFRDPARRDELHPSFVWWHTVAHLLIRAISVEAGYSSASVRERVYVETQQNRVRGGILLYATQPGTEGTLGGLIALAPTFQSALDSAFGSVQICSGDPLCREHVFTPGQYNGSACYGCLLLSETSCEHRNMWLDRNVVLENLP